MFSLSTISALGATLMVIGCNSSTERPTINDVDASMADSAPPPPRAVRGRSLVELIAVPDRHRGEFVSVTGYFEPDHEPPHGILFLDDMSGRMNILENALHVRFGNCRRVTSASGMLDWLDGEHTGTGYTLIQGIFEPAEPRGLYAGEICSVTRFKALGPTTGVVKGWPDASAPAPPSDAGGGSRSP